MHNGDIPEEVADPVTGLVEFTSYRLSRKDQSIIPEEDHQRVVELVRTMGARGVVRYAAQIACLERHVARLGEPPIPAG